MLCDDVEGWDAGRRGKVKREGIYIYIYIIYICICLYIYIYILPAVQAGFRKGRGTRDQIANIH